MVRNMRAVQKTGFCGTRRIFRSIRCKKQASVVRKRYSVPETPSYGTGYIFRAPYRKGPLPFWHLSHSVRAMLSFFWQFEKFGTGEGLLWYGICARCKKQASVVRDAFSGALGAQNRLFWYGRDIRYRKPPSLVRGAFSGAPGAQNRLLWYGSDTQLLQG